MGITYHIIQIHCHPDIDPLSLEVRIRGVGLYSPLSQVFNWEAWHYIINKQKNVSIYREQELANLLLQKKYLKAIGLAITLEQPFRVLNIMKGMFLVLQFF